MLRLCRTSQNIDHCELQVWGYTYSDNIQHNRLTAERLNTTVHTITGESAFFVVPAECDPVAPPGCDASHLWVIHNISPAGGQRVVKQRVWSLPDITFFTQAHALEFPCWILALEGFVHANEATITRMVCAVMECLEHRQMIEEMLATNPSYAGAHRVHAVQLILNSLRVKILTLNNGNIIANVYMDSLTRDTQWWHTWVTHLRSIMYGDYTNAMATPWEVRWCLGCQSTAHLMHLCPFPALPGWNGTPIEDEGPGGHQHYGGPPNGGFFPGRG